MAAADELLEFSVIYTDRAKNLMAGSFSQAFTDITDELKAVYQADECIMIPGSGHFAMEAVVGQFPLFKNEEGYRPCMVVRNGFFSFRWSDIWSFVYPESCPISPELKVIKAEPTDETTTPSFAAPKVEDVVAQIKEHKPRLVFCPHVETSAGLIVNHEFIKAIADAVHENEDSLFVLDCIASGNAWIKMADLGVDILITAPQKGWSGPACVGIAMLNAKAKALMLKQNAEKLRGHSLSMNLGKWGMVADAYKAPGGFMYHTTLPTDALMTFRDVIMETKAFGYALTEERMAELGSAVRGLLEERGFKSVAAEGFKAPTVVVAYMRGEQDKDIVKQFKAHGVQIAAGVPLKVDEPWPAGPPPTFRIGLFGLDKLGDVPKTVASFKAALDAMEVY